MRRHKLKYRLNSVTNEDKLLNEYDDYLDEIYGEVMNGEFTASQILKNLDINKYNSGFTDFKNNKDKK